MTNVIVVGLQWGDEGKGKIVDFLCSNFKHVVRAQGGNNAGHTIIADNIEHKLHLIPSGILHPHLRCYIGAGVVIDSLALISEIENLEKQNICVKNRLFISPFAHVILPYHIELDRLIELQKNTQKIGTTGKGIGPCYADKVKRYGIRFSDFLHPSVFFSRLSTVVPLKNEELQQFSSLTNPVYFDVQSIYDAYAPLAKKLYDYMSPVESMLAQAIKQRESILFEGAQGSFLDVSFGTYPFVTSSSTIAGGICAGAGIGPSKIDQVLGIAKAYTTRVGSGPFPSELSEGENKLFNHTTSREYGTTTGRMRRMGWFDAVLVKHSIHLNGVDALALMKLDILDTLDFIKICVGYQIDGETYLTPPPLIEDFEKIQPIYETFPGWKRNTRQCKTFDDLPLLAQNYVKKIEELCEVSIRIISIGPERAATIGNFS